MTLKEYLIQDRQWPRHCRIAHANFQLERATVPKDKSFWKAVLKANAAEEYQQHAHKK